MWKSLKRKVYTILIPFIRLKRMIAWKWYLASAKEINLVVGAGGTAFPGWFSTDIDTLDLTKESDFERYFRDKKINRVLAEHVLEHLTEQEILTALRLIHKYSSFDVTIRIAVPDGFHSDPVYINKVKPGGTGSGAHDHKHLFTYLSMIELFYKAGFTGNPVEYFDEHGKFHQGYTHDDKGYVSRSFINDARNKDGIPQYTSLIIDFTKVE